MSNNRQWAWLLAIAILFSGCTAPAGPLPPLPDPRAIAQAPVSSCPGSLVEGNQKRSNEQDTIIVGGLAQDIARLSTWMSERGDLFGQVRVNFPFPIDNNTAFLDGEKGVPQPDWFAFDLTQPGGDLSAISYSLFHVEPNSLDRDATYVIARAQVTPNPGAEYISRDNLDVFGVAQIAAASDTLFSQQEIELPVTAQLNNTVNVPRTVGIDPNGVGAHGCGELTPTNGTADMFWDQWALQESPGIRVLPRSIDTGCNLPPPLAGTAPTEGAAAVGPPSVPVVIFDTASLEVPLSDGLGLDTLPLDVDLHDPCGLGDLNVTVSSYLTSTVTDTPWNRHGLFVAGLVYAAWRHADIHLARVIDNDGKGDLFTLLKAMMHWRQMLGPEPSPAVFNLSLGIDPATATFSDSEKEALKKLVADTQDLGGPSGSYVPLETDAGVPGLASPTGAPAVTLETVIRLLTESGIGIVAAAGNDYVPGKGGARPLEQYPAMYKSVLGVAALSGDPVVGLASYSNRGDVAAPGGSGESATCTTVDCVGGVLSVYAQDIPTTSEGLAFWSGTSFAAPLVSGLFAQRYAAYLRDKGTTASKQTLESFVTDMLDCGSVSVEGICIADMEDAPRFP